MKIAAFTMVHNEAQLLPVWLSYYQRYFDSLYVLDDRSTDDTIKKCKKKYKFEVVPLSQHDFSYLEWRVMTVREQQSKLLSEYDWVLFSDTDEIVIPDPQKFKGLRDYISQLKKDFVSCTGRVVVHLPDLINLFCLVFPFAGQRVFIVLKKLTQVLTTMNERNYLTRI